jgi:hypothetical protein
MSTIGVLPLRKSFAGDTPWHARSAASKWLSDFSRHGPLHIGSIRVIENGNMFEAVVTYSEMRPLEPEISRLPKPAEPLLKTG